jgi:hypothetical protein
VGELVGEDGIELAFRPVAPFDGQSDRVTDPAEAEGGGQRVRFKELRMSGDTELFDKPSEASWGGAVRDWGGPAYERVCGCDADELTDDQP